MGAFEGIKGQVFSRHVTVVILAFMSSIGLTLLILGCALSEYNWWPLFLIIFYVLCPMPTAIVRRCSASSYGMDDTNTGTDVSWFITSVLVFSAFAFPIVLLRANIIIAGSTGFVMTANVVIFSTIALYFLTYGSEDSLSSV